MSVHILFGDNPGTARAIAARVSIIPSNVQAIAKDAAAGFLITFSSFHDKLSDDHIDKLLALPLIIVRCAPRTKVRMIEGLHRRGTLAAMTEDRVDHPPSLKRAFVPFGFGDGDLGQNCNDNYSDRCDTFCAPAPRLLYASRGPRSSWRVGDGQHAALFLPHAASRGARNT